MCHRAAPGHIGNNAWTGDGKLRIGTNAAGAAILSRGVLALDVDQADANFGLANIAPYQGDPRRVAIFHMSGNQKKKVTAKICPLLLVN